ncbi:hypothetical protein DMK57_14555 [Salmonella enterica]|nr:hypothetical protein [Salmonella enterica]
MKYDGDGRETARFFSDKGCRRAPLFTAPADAARHKRCLWSVSRVRRARDAVNSPQAAGNGHHRGALPVPSVREGALLCPVLSLVTASML